MGPAIDHKKYRVVFNSNGAYNQCGGDGGDFMFGSPSPRPDFQTGSKQRGFKEDPYIFFEKDCDFFDNIT